MATWHVIQRHPRLRLPLLLGLVYLALNAALRVVLWAVFGVAAAVGTADLPTILAAGAVNDAVELLYLLAPLSLVLLVWPARWTRHRWHRGIVGTFTYLALFGMFYLAAAEYFFFEEFDARFNLVAVDYLIYPHEVLVNLWDSYPVATALAIDAALSGAVLALLWPRLAGSLSRPTRFRKRLRWAAVHLALLGAALGAFSTDTLAHTHNRVANELAANGVSSLFRAFRTNELAYDAYYRTVEPERALATLRARLAADEGDPGRPWGAGPTRHHPPRGEGLGKKNVVVIVEESLGAGFVGAYGDTRGLTPHLDRLAGDGLLFRDAYATGTRTVRGLEAITVSFPPIPSEAILKRPGCEDLPTWGQVMAAQGYHTSFLYGGYAYFDNMEHFFASNGFEVRDRADIPDPGFANIWGVSDGDLFRYALSYYDGRHAAGRPFFSVVMTTSNHKPYTFPAGIDGVPPRGGGRKAGVRYADHALGRLFELAAGHPWFRDTLFVVVADHDARVYGRAQVPVPRYRIPLLFYAPGLLPPGEVAGRVSQMDVAPTVLGLLGLEYTAPFFGQDALHPDTRPGRPILLNHNHDVALLLGDRLEVLGLNRAAETFRYRAADGSLEPVAEDEELRDLATAYYQTAYEWFRAGGRGAEAAGHELAGLHPADPPGPVRNGG